MFMRVASKMVGCSEMVCSEEVGGWGCCWGCCWIDSISIIISGWLVGIVVYLMGGILWGEDGNCDWDVGCCYIVFCGVCSVMVMISSSIVSSVFVVSRSFEDGDSFDRLEMVVIGNGCDWNKDKWNINNYRDRNSGVLSIRRLGF